MRLQKKNKKVDEAFSIVIEDSDSYTGMLHNHGIANDEFHFLVKTYEPLIPKQNDEDNFYYQSYL
jgi:hypothetical protein